MLFRSDSLFSTTLHAFTAASTSDVEKNKHLQDLTECLKTYHTLGLWRDAEDVLRREVVREFVKKVASFFSRILGQHR